MDKFKRGDEVYIKEGKNYIKATVVKKVMPYHGVVYDKDKTKYSLYIEGSDFRRFIEESEIIPKIVFDREEKFKKLGI
jgi:ribosomal protein L24